MSYSIKDNCFGCSKRKECEDIKEIELAVDIIHNNTNHKGAGEINLFCWNNDSDCQLYSFENALYALKCGKAIKREGWKDMFVYYVSGGDYKTQTNIAKKEFGDAVKYNPYFAVKNQNGTVSIWIPSVNDCLATDWVIL